MKIYLPLAFLVLFFGWILYRILIKKDMKKNLNSLYLGVDLLFFIENLIDNCFICMENNKPMLSDYYGIYACFKIIIKSVFGQTCALPYPTILHIHKQQINKNLR
jgi:hypothetical protein